MRLGRQKWLPLPGERVGVRPAGLLALLLCVCLPSCAPHMQNQPNIKPYKQKMPAMPAGTTPTKGRAMTLVVQQARLATNPVAATPSAVKNGRIYYGYYCLMCHGKSGDGNGPVGESYVPKPTDLGSPAVAALTDGQLYQRMLTGVGHDPVMVQTVLPGHRWPLVAYVRTFAKKSP